MSVRGVYDFSYEPKAVVWLRVVNFFSSTKTNAA